MRIVLIAGLCVLCMSQIFANDSNYVAEMNEWRAQRKARLQETDGWLSLAGLFWLNEGENTFGGDASNDIRFSQNKADDFIGTFSRTGNNVVVNVKDGVSVTAAGVTVTSLELQSDMTGTPTILKHRSLLFFVIVRGDRVGIRLKDTESDIVKNFAGIPMYPIDESWKIKARLEPYDPPKTLKIPDALGDVSDSPCPGALVFEYAGQEYRLDPIGDIGASSYFLIFADETSGDETYGAGRFLSIKGVDESGETFIDFNKSYNPPCAFTPYATCPLPPPGNRLPFKVTAGEKNYGDGHH